MSHIKIMVHCVWGTKHRTPLLTKERRIAIIQYIQQSAKQKRIFIDCINGHTDHLHALVSLGGKQNIADVMQQIKGGTSHWANNTSGIFTERFQWADKYFAVFVSESQLYTVRNYIHNQEQHHQKVTFQQEYGNFISKYGFVEFG